MVCASASLKSNINNHGCVQTFFAVWKGGVPPTMKFTFATKLEKTSFFFLLVINYRILSFVRILTLRFNNIIFFSKYNVCIGHRYRLYS